MIYVLLFIILMVIIFWFIISRFGSSSLIKDINEYDFLTKFIDLEDELHINIVPQVNLASIIQKVSNSRFNTELFRNIDFGIFSADYSKILLLIELNDESHNNFHRKKRDIKVHEICNKAGIKLITFYTKYSNEKEYVKGRILKELNMPNKAD